MAIYRHCPQCFKGYETKAQFIDHMVNDYQHRYSKAASMRAWKKADAHARAEELQASIEALGLVSCKGCKAAIAPETVGRDFGHGNVYCGACYRVVDGLGWLIKTAFSDYGYGYQTDDASRDFISAGYESFEKAERHLRSHQAQIAMQPDNWLAGIELIVSPVDRKEHLGYVAWQMTAQRLGYTTHDCRFGDERFGAFSKAEQETARNLYLQYQLAA